MYCEMQGIQTNSILSAEIRVKLSDINIKEGKDIYSVKLGLLDRYLAAHLFPLYVAFPCMLRLLRSYLQKAASLILQTPGCN